MACLRVESYSTRRTDNQCLKVCLRLLITAIYKLNRKDTFDFCYDLDRGMANFFRLCLGSSLDSSLCVMGGRHCQYRRKNYSPAACTTALSSLIGKSLTLLCWFEDLERAHECFIDRHHGTGIVKLSTVVWRREEGDELPASEKL